MLFIGSGDQFAWISGSWTVPHAYATPGAAGTEYCAAWLGIDGDGSRDVMQAGAQTLSNGACYAWHEWFPEPEIQIPNFTVGPGDVVSLLLCTTSSTTAWVSIGNLTSGQYTNFAFSAPVTTPPTTLGGPRHHAWWTAAQSARSSGRAGRSRPDGRERDAEGNPPPSRREDDERG